MSNVTDFSNITEDRPSFVTHLECSVGGLFLDQHHLACPRSQSGTVERRGSNDPPEGGL